MYENFFWWNLQTLPYELFMKSANTANDLTLSLQLDLLDEKSKIELPYPYEMVFRLQKGREREN